MEKRIIKINTEYIQLNQLLKLADIISSGGEMKWFMEENDIFYNGEIETRLRKKIYNNDIVVINDDIEIQVNIESK